MRERDFEHWMTHDYRTDRGTVLDPHSRRSTLSNCRRVERHEGDLDRHFATDRLRSLIASLAAGRTRIRVQGESRPVMNSLRSAVGLYREFSEAWPAGAPAPTAGESRPARRSAEVLPSSEEAGHGGADWPTWDVPSDDQILELARALTPYVRFLHPEVVRAVVEDNERRRREWEQALAARGIEASRYLWDRSPCAFPGVRRSAGSAEIAGRWKRGRAPEGPPPQALTTDDNSYPKHLWSFVFRGKPFQNFGPRGYQLAHLADHKDHGCRLVDELDEAAGLDDRVPYGLYTCASNATYVPEVLLRPTDRAGPLRSLLQRRARDLYGGVCNLYPPPARVRDASSGAWACSTFRWAEPVGDARRIQSFLEFRAKKMADLLAPSASTTS